MGRWPVLASPWEEDFLVCALGMAKQFGYPTHNLLGFMARRRFNHLLNPASLKYLIEAYRYLTVSAAMDNWVPRWPEFTSYYATVPNAWTVPSGFNSTDHGYGFIALAAVSYLYDETVDGYKGQKAWNLFNSEKPGQDKIGIYSPKWAILPLTTSVGSIGDTRPPAAPQSLAVD